MKRFLAAIAATLVAAGGIAATLSPVQLLNPAGSAAGHAIVSNGPSTAPAWSAVSATALAPIAANTLLGNATGASAAPTAVAVPSCSTSASALNWTSGSGLTCNVAVNAAQLGGATFAAPGAIGSTTPSTGAFTTISATGAITPSQTAGIVGTTTNNNANAGSFGEYVTNSASGVSLTTATTANITSVSLTAGDWDVSGAVTYSPAGSTTVSALTTGISTTSATLPSNNTGGYNLLALSFTTGATQVHGTQDVRISIAGTTTVYLVAQAQFGVSTMTANGFIRARRVR